MISIVKIDLRQPFAFQRSKKRFGDSIVPAVSFPTHALDKMMHCKRLSERLAAILHAAVRMDHNSGRQPASPYSAIQCLQNPFVAQRSTHEPSYDHAGKKVNKHRQVQPATAAGKIGDIADEHLVRSTDRKMSVQQVLCHRKIVLRVRRNTEPPSGFEPQSLPGPYWPRHASGLLSGHEGQVPDEHDPGRNGLYLPQRRFSPQDRTTVVPGYSCSPHGLASCNNRSATPQTRLPSFPPKTRSCDRS